MIVNQTKIKVTPSTSTINFNNTSHAYYDMIITIQNISISQAINIYDVEGNIINDKPLTFNYPIKIILKNVALGSISFSDINVYDVILSYVIKSNPEGVPYIDFITETSVHPTIPVNSFYQTEFSLQTTIDFSTLLANAGITNKNSIISIQSIVYYYTASATNSYENTLAVLNTGTNTAAYIDNFNTSVTSGDVWVFTFNSSIYEFQTITGSNQVLIPLPNPIIISNGQGLYILSDEDTNITTVLISYQVLS